MIALYRAGRQQTALAIFDEVKANFGTDLGVVPSPELVSIRDKILGHAPEVQAPHLVPYRRPQIGRLAERARLRIPAYLTRASEVPFIGRAPEIKSISEALHTALNGQPQLRVVRGEPGIGKTRLAAATAERATAAGFNVTYGRSDEGLSIPYQAWIEALSHLADSIPVGRRSDHHDSFGDALVPLIPNLYSPLRAASESAKDAPAGASQIDLPTSTSDHRQMALFQATLGLLKLAATQAPLLLILDDIQWADASTLRLLEHAAQRCNGRIVLMVLYRDTRIATDSPLVELVGRLSPLPSAETIDLDGLDVGDITEVIANLGGSHNNVGLAQRVRDQTNGNPFFATEMVRHVIASAPTTNGSSPASVPVAVQQIIHRRVAQLGTDVATALQAASAFGRHFELDLLAQVLAKDDFEVLDQLEIALADGLLTDVDSGYDRFQFTHDLVHQALYDELNTSRRSRIHRRIADAIEELRPDDRHARSGEIAGHLLAVGDRRLAMRTCLMARDAGRAAATAIAPAAAAGWFVCALEQLDLAAIDDPSLRARLLTQLGEQQLYGGRMGYRESLVEAEKLAASVGDTGTLAAASLSNTRGTFSNLWEVDREVVDLLTIALDRLDPAETGRRAMVLATLASEEWDLSDEVVIARHEESVALAEQSNNPQVLADALMRYVRARGLFLPIDKHHEVNRRVRTLVDEEPHADPMLRVSLLLSELHLALLTADAEATHRVLAETAELADRLALPFAEAGRRLGQTLVLGIEGDPVKYEEAAGSLLEYNLERGDPEAIVVYEAHLLYTRLMQGRIGELIGELDRIIAERPDAELYPSVAAFAHLEEGNLEAAAAQLEQACQRGFVVGNNVFVVQSLGFWSEVAAATGNTAACRTLYDHLVPSAGQFLGNMTQLTQPVDLTLGRLCTTLGRYDDAAKFFASSARIAAAFEAPWMVARTSLYQAVLAQAAGAGAAVVEQYGEAALDIAEIRDYRTIVRDARAALGVTHSMVSDD